MSMICARQRPNSSMIMDSVSASETPRRSLSSACASMHWQLASTTSGVMKLNGCLQKIEVCLVHICNMLVSFLSLLTTY